MMKQSRKLFFFLSFLVLIVGLESCASGHRMGGKKGGRGCNCPSFK